MSAERYSGDHSFRAVRQKGVVLMIALIALVALSLAGVGLMRSVDASMSLAGNLAFRQMTTNAAEIGVDTARTFLNGPTQAALGVVSSANGYNPLFVLTPPDWTQAGSWSGATTTTDPVTNATINVRIDRMCTSPTVCVSTPAPTTTDNSSHDAGGSTYATPPNKLYRITVRVTGPRNSTAYIQSYVARS